jgi:hypothetical protein
MSVLAGRMSAVASSRSLSFVPQLLPFHLLFLSFIVLLAKERKMCSFGKTKFVCYLAPRKIK